MKSRWVPITVSAFLLLAIPAVAPAVAAPASVPEAINPMTGESEPAEELRARLARLQIQSRIETELTSIERSRQERRRMGGDIPTTGHPGPWAPVRAARREPALVAPPRPSTSMSAAPLPAPASPGPAGDSSRLVGIVSDGTARLAISETPSGTRTAPAAATAGGTDESPSRLDAAPGHIELPREPARAAIPPALAGALAPDGAAFARLGIALPAVEAPR